MLDELDEKIIAAMQDEFPLVAEPYREIAARLNISEAELLTRLQQYRKDGRIRKMGAVLRHREVGYAANALCAWNVPLERTEEIGVQLAAQETITHCYVREAQPDWRYNFYTMLHAHTREECRNLAEEISRQTGITDYIMLFSTKEWKKTSMRYFCE